ncbi:hypothetical protein EMCG_08430 [[Emmonsia] crescens]|uniref:Uncharacterized protein n=1 Tax=[Emmonsia] crescens TaxID=73230 RepID=A0A0G2I680_9EURO|nr:hypothetical protein EMCG_08430 [Emmonsia crescens UAMH 3008]
MPEAFNFNPSKGMRRDGNNIPPGDWDGVNNPYAPYTSVAGRPEWTNHVPSLDKEYLQDIMPERMLDAKGRLFLHEEADSRTFVKRNIVA